MKCLIVFVLLGVLSCQLTLAEGWEQHGLTWPFWSSKSLRDILFLNDSTGWAIGDSGWIMHSTDGGTNWSFENTGTTTNLRDVKFADAGHGWAFGSDGHILAFTGGNTWTNQASGTEQNLNDAVFLDANTGWAVGDSGIILHTTDGGGMWAMQTSGSTQNFGALEFADANHGWALGDGRTICRTTDGGTTWNSQSILDTLTDVWLHDVEFVDATHGWVVGFCCYNPHHMSSESICLYTTDGGETWSETESPFPPAVVIEFVDALHGWTYAIEGNEWGMWFTFARTVDGGASWTYYYPDHEFGGMNFINANEGWVLSGERFPPERKIRHTSDGGATWQWLDQINGTTGTLLTVDFVNLSIGWAAGDEMLRTVDGGETWNTRGYSANDEDFIDAFNGWAVGIRWSSIWGEPGYGIIMHTSDGGVTWSSQYSDTSGSPLRGVDVVDLNDGWAVGDSATIVRTTNGGATWTFQNAPTSVNLRSVAFANATNGWAVGDSGTILHTSDGGNAWALQHSDTSYALHGVFAADVNTGWAVGGPEGATQDPSVILHTEDGGGTWTAQANGVMNWLSRVASVDANNGWAVGQGGAIIHTTDGGDTWSRQTSGTSLDLYGVSFVDENHGWVVGSEGMILSTTNGGASWVPDDGHASAIPRSVALAAYPNPFNPLTAIAYDLPRAGQISLRVFDLLGREVAVLKDGLMEAGTHRIMFDGSGLPSGVYFARLLAGNASLTRKIMLLK